MILINNLINEKEIKLTIVGNNYHMRILQEVFGRIGGQPHPESPREFTQMISDALHSSSLIKRPNHFNNTVEGNIYFKKTKIEFMNGDIDCF